MVSNLKTVAEKLARKQGLHMNDAEVMVKEVLEIITDEIVTKGGFMYRGNFSITRRVRKGKKGRVNGKEYVSKDHTILAISTGTMLLDRLNSK